MSKTSSKKTKNSKPKVHKIKAGVKVDSKKTAKKPVEVKKTKATTKIVTKTRVVTDNPEKQPLSDKKTSSKAKPSDKVTSNLKKAKKSRSVLGKILLPVVKLIRYIKNSFRELKKVHWPSRKSTWAMTFAVVGYAVFFLVLVLMLDNFFSFIFKLMIGQ